MSGGQFVPSEVSYSGCSDVVDLVFGESGTKDNISNKKVKLFRMKMIEWELKTGFKNTFLVF